MPESPERLVVVFETHSAVLVLGAWRAVRRADEVVFSRRVPLSPVSGAAKRRAMRVVRLLNGHATVREVTTDQLLDYLPLNVRGVAVVAELATEIRRTASFRALKSLVGTDDVVRYFQGSLAIRAANWGLFPKVVHRLSEDAQVIGVADWDTRELAHLFGEVPKFHGGAGAWARRLGSAIAARVAATAVPLVVVTQALRKGWRRTPPQQFAVAMPVAWGIKTEPGGRPHSDDHLYGGRLHPGDIVHVFGGFGVGGADQTRYESAMRARGYRFVDQQLFALTGETVAAAARTFVQALRLWVTGWAGSGVDRAVLREAPKGFFHFLRKRLEYGNVRGRAEVVRNDYNPGHVIATALARQHGIRTISIHHNALPYESPQLAFMDIDGVALFGDFYRKGYAPHWDRLTLHRTGRESLDWALEVVGDPARRSAVTQRWRAIRPAEAPTLLVLFPSERDITIPSKWAVMYDALQRVLLAHPEIDVVLRFRTQQSLAAPHVGQFLTLTSNDRCFVAPAELSTYELLAVAGLVLTYDGSFTVNEGTAAGVPTFSFEFIGAGGYYFNEYGKDFVLRTQDDVERTVRAWRHGALDQLDVDWEGLRRDLNCHADGGNRDRLRIVMEQAAS